MEKKKYRFEEARKKYLKEFFGNEEVAMEADPFGDEPDEDILVDPTLGNADLELAYKRMLRHARLSGVPSSRSEAMLSEVFNLYNTLVTAKYSFSVANYLKRSLMIFYKRVQG